MMMTHIVVKVGGSLYDWPELRRRLRGYLDCIRSECVLVVPGGGPTVAALRDLDRVHQLGEKVAHNLALRILSANACFLAALLERGVVVLSLEECNRAWERAETPILDCFAYLGAASEGETGLPESWDVTSDSIAAYVANHARARRLILLKSTEVPTREDWVEAARRGFVDPWFARTVGPNLSVEAVNLRRWPIVQAHSPAE
jgi:aspartokinase-like uncharacterized kinase